MESTVQPDKKLMLATLSTPKASRIGLISTPPPIPQIAPTTDAPKLTPRNIKYKYKLIMFSSPSPAQENPPFPETGRCGNLLSYFS